MWRKYLIESVLKTLFESLISWKPWYVANALLIAAIELSQALFEYVPVVLSILQVGMPLHGRRFFLENKLFTHPFCKWALALLLQVLLTKRSFQPSVDDSQDLGKTDSGPRVRMRNVAAYPQGKSFIY